MGKTKNYHYWGTPEKVAALYDDYTFIGRRAKIVEPGHLVVFALPKKKEKHEKEKQERTSRRNTYSSNK